MRLFKEFRFYTGTPGWGWKLYGFGCGPKWFLGLSIRQEKDAKS